MAEQREWNTNASVRGEEGTRVRHQQIGLYIQFTDPPHESVQAQHDVTTCRTAAEEHRTRHGGRPVPKKL